MGDSWTVNSSGAVHALLSDGLRVKAKNIEGSMKLDEVVVLDGLNCLHLNGKMQISKAIPSLPPGISIEDASVTAEFSGDFPFDISMGRISETMVMRKDLVGRGKSNPYSQEFILHRETILSAKRELRFQKGRQ